MLSVHTQKREESRLKIWCEQAGTQTFVNY